MEHRAWILGTIVGVVPACSASSSDGSSAGFMPGQTSGADDDGDDAAGDDGADDDGVDDDGGGDGGPMKLDLPGGAGGEGTGPCQTALIGVLRDFHPDHPDFERDIVGEDYGIVESRLGEDGKPVYAGGTASTTTDAASFDQWYRDVEGVNVALPIKIGLTEDPEKDGYYVYDNRYFFPADDEGFGNEGLDHNYHFTLEIRTSFEYRGGEVFTFRGDDDLFTYVNGHLGIDLGGVHLPLTQTIDMDAVADEFGLEIGETYSLDFFFAERHTTLSNFRIETSIECFTPVG